MFHVKSSTAPPPSTGRQEFTATIDWAEYALVGVATKDDPRAQIGLSLVSAGTAWFGALQFMEN